jgi:hypothetical protein
MVYFQTKNTNLGKFFRALDLKTLKYFTAIQNILRTFGKCYGQLVNSKAIWYIQRPFGTFCVDSVHFFPVLVSRPKKNMATLDESCIISHCYLTRKITIVRNT